MTDRVALIVTTLVGGIVPSILFLVVAMMGASFARIQVASLVFGIGPKLFSRKIDRTQIELHLVPFNSYFTAVGINPYESPESLAEARALLPPGRTLWRDASPFRRALAFVIAPRLLVLLLAVAILGPTEALMSSARGVTQFVTGALGPLSTAPTLLATAATTLARVGPLAGFAFVLTKWLGFSMLALPTDIIGATDTGPPASAKTTAKLRAVFMLVSFVVFAAWLVGLVAWLWRG